MAIGESIRGTCVSGTYRCGSRAWGVTLRRRGEGLELLSLDAAPAALQADARDIGTAAALYTAPRAGADRYPDWSAWEWKLRLGPAGDAEQRVWRVAETTDWAAFLGQAVWPDGTNAAFPLAAALWRAWSRRNTRQPRALFWQSDVQGHLWLTRPFELPAYQGVDRDVSPDDLLLAVTQLADPRNITLELGGVESEFRRRMERHFPGSVRVTEPFADLMVGEPLRAEVAQEPDPAGYLPAIGAALALVEGPPPCLNLCASWPEAAAGVA